MTKIQFMAIIDQRELDRLDALRIVMGVSRAEVNRQAVADATGPIGALEQQHRERLQRLYRLAEEEGASDWRLWVRDTVKGRRSLPTLEGFEALAREARGEPAPTGRIEALRW